MPSAPKTKKVAQNTSGPEDLIPQCPAQTLLEKTNSTQEKKDAVNQRTKMPVREKGKMNLVDW